MLAPIGGMLEIAQLFASLKGGPGEAYDAIHDGITYRCVGHAGIDISCPVGTPVVAMKPGLLRYFAPKGLVPGDPYPDDGYGPLGLHAVVVLGTGEQHWLAHLSKAEAAEGSIVAAGERIALSGDSGASTGPHLHVAWRPFPIRYDNGFDGFDCWLSHLNHDVFATLDLSRV